MPEKTSSKAPGSAARPERTSAGGRRRPSRTLSPAMRREMLILMNLAREWDLRFENLARTGSLGKWYSSVGNEALTVASALTLLPGDALLTLHRDVGAILSHCLDVRGLFPELLGRAGSDCEESRQYLYRLACQMMGREDGFTRGFERSYHFGAVDLEKERIHVGMISHLGAMIPVAAGIALAHSTAGGGRVALNFVGEGGTSTGDFHEALNIAAIWKLPLILVIENNGYAFSTPTSEQYACKRLSERGSGYGIPASTIDGNDPEIVFRTVREAVNRARRGGGPGLIEARLGRLRGHAEGDGSIDVVPEEDRRRYAEGDPVENYERSLLDGALVDEVFLEKMHREIRQLLIDITDRAREAADPDPGKLLSARTVFAPAGEVVETPEPSTAGATEAGAVGETTYLDAITRGLREEMLRDEAVLLMGQDIAEFGGAFRVTSGLVEEFGRARVRNTPIAESGTIGIAVGAALVGRRPVVEMQFADFISCGFNQVVNVAAKMYFRWRGAVPLVIRCPFGAGDGAGPFHSQSPEAWFAHVPGLKIVAPAFPRDALGLLKAAIRDPNPVLFFEHKHLYRRVREPLPRGEVLVPLGRARVVRRGEDVTAVTYGWMVHRTLKAVEHLAAEGVSVEVLDLRSLVPLDRAAILASVERTSKALVIHEASRTCGLGAEVAAWIADEAFEYLDGPVRRLASPDIPVPYNKKLEAARIPDEERIGDALRELARY